MMASDSGDDKFLSYTKMSGHIQKALAHIKPLVNTKSYDIYKKP